MIYALAGLVFGWFVPYAARRFGKFMPATMAYALYRIFKPLPGVPRKKAKENPKYQQKVREYRGRKLLYALAAAGLSYVMFWKYGEAHIGWQLLFVWLALLLAEVDLRWQILPDIITVPLLIAGFGYAVFGGDWAGPGESFIGAAAGYVLPVAASLFLVWKNKDVFGGGDIKYLAATGAWLGPEKLPAVILLACVLFGLYALCRKKRDGAFGPAIAGGALVMAFL